MFLLRRTTLPAPADLLPADDHACGGLVVFEGRVRDHHEGRPVVALEYQVYDELARREGERILAEARERFAPVRVAAAHRHGRLELGEAAVVVVAASPHREEAFAACRWVIDRIKERLPIWKLEFYADGERAWVACGCGHTGERP